MNRDAQQRIVAFGGALLLCVAMIPIYASRRGPYFAEPRTVVDHASVREHETHAALILIPQVEPLIPRGAAVTAFRPKDGKSWNDDGVYLTAVGLLPHHSVMPPWTAGEIDYVIAVGAPFDDPSYAPVAGFPNGWLYKRR